MMKKVVALLLLGLVFSLQACNTMRGAGRDIERTGEVIQGK